MLLKEPFYAHFLSGVVRKVTNEVPTAAVGVRSGKINLFVNEDFFLKELKTTSQRVAVIKHETLHIIFKHLFRLGLKNYNLKIFNIAADIIVNQFIGNWDLPKNAITLNTFPDLDLEANQTVEWYYDKLFKLNEENKKKQKNNSDSSQNETQSSETNTSSSAPVSAKNLKKILSNQIKSPSDHSLWGKESSSLKDAIETEIDRMLVQAKDRVSSKEFGNIPAGISSLISIAINKRKPKINWKRALHIFSTSSRRTRIYHSMKRISKRYGTRPGIKIKRFQKMAVAVDTSGSIPLKAYNLFFTEIYAIWKQGAEIEIIECDAAVNNTYQYRGKTPNQISGGGGTSFNPVFKYLKENRFEKYDGCIYLTDGYASEPTIKPPCKLFWVITPDGDLGKHLKYGKAVKIN